METGYFAHPVRARDVKEDDLMVLFGVDHRVVQTARLEDIVIIRLEPLNITPGDANWRQLELRTHKFNPMKVFYKDQ